MVGFTFEFTISSGVSVQNVDFDPSSSYIATNSGYPGIYIYDTSNTQQSNYESGSLDSIDAFRWSPGGSYFAFAQASDCKILDVSDVTNPTLHSTLTQAGDTIHDVGWSPDGNWLAYASEDGNTYVHANDPANGFPFETSVQINTSGNEAVVFSYDSSLMATVEGDYLGVYDVTSSFSNIEENYRGTNTYDTTFKADDSYLFSHETGGLGSYYLDAISTSDFSETRTNAGVGVPAPLHHNPSVGKNTLAFVQPSDNSVEVHNTSDVSSFSLIETFFDASDTVNDVRWSDDGSWFAFASDDGNNYVYSVSYATFSGTVTDSNSNAVSGATVYAINDSDGTITGSATTDSNGAYSITAPDTSTQHHLICQWTDGSGNEYYSKSLPYVTAYSA